MRVKEGIGGQGVWVWIREINCLTPGLGISSGSPFHVKGHGLLFGIRVSHDLLSCLGVLLFLCAVCPSAPRLGYSLLGPGPPFS